jgi:hypothetical protein
MLDSGIQGDTSVLDFDNQGDTLRVRIRQSGRHGSGSMLEFDIADCTRHFPTNPANTDEGPESPDQRLQTAILQPVSDHSPTESIRTRQNQRPDEGKTARRRQREGIK